MESRINEDTPESRVPLATSASAQRKFASMLAWPVQDQATMFRFRSCSRAAIIAILSCTACLSPSHAIQNPAHGKWVRVSSDHFSVLTDAGEKEGREVAVRFEQMRAVLGRLLLKTQLKMPEPLEIVAFKTDAEYAACAPLTHGEPTKDAAFFVSGEDRNYIVLNIFEPESWRSVAYEFAHLFLSFNVYPSQGWFDEGFAEYFSTISVNDNDVEMGADPELQLQWQEDIFGNEFPLINPPPSLTEILESPVWLSVPDLFTLTHSTRGYRDGTHHILFYAQSWMVVHYLLNRDKIGQTRTYFELVQQGTPVSDAIQRAYGMTAIQFDQAVKDYYHSLLPLFLALDASKSQEALELGMPDPQTYAIAAPLRGEDVATSTTVLPDPQAAAMVREMEVRSPQHRQETLNELQTLVSNRTTATAVAHRALAWVDLERGNSMGASAKLDDAARLDSNDPWGNYEFALLKDRENDLDDSAVQHLQRVLAWDPDFAAAHYLLAKAQLRMGHTDLALQSIRAAVSLSPRNQNYQLQMADIYIRAHDRDPATAILNNLKHSTDLSVFRAARSKLDSLGKE